MVGPVLIEKIIKLKELTNKNTYDKISHQTRTTTLQTSNEFQTPSSISKSKNKITTLKTNKPSTPSNTVNKHSKTFKHNKYFEQHIQTRKTPSET